MPPNPNFDHITLVLHQPRFAENIGASARAAWNMGLSHIIVVNPEDTDWERMTKLSTHMARGLLEKMKTYSSLAEALAPFQYIVGTTARLGGQRKEIIGPSQAARKIHSLDRSKPDRCPLRPRKPGTQQRRITILPLYRPHPDGLGQFPESGPGRSDPLL